MCQEVFCPIAGQTHLNWLRTKQHLEWVIMIPAALEALAPYTDFDRFLSSRFPILLFLLRLSLLPLLSAPPELRHLFLLLLTEEG